MTENVKVIKDSLSAFAPRNYVIYVENGAITCLDATQLAPTAVTHENQGPQPPIDVAWSAALLRRSAI